MLSKTMFILASAATLVNSQFDPTSVPYATRRQLISYTLPPVYRMVILTYLSSLRGLV
jgi:hypothetical protein